MIRRAAAAAIRLSLLENHWRLARLRTINTEKTMRFIALFTLIFTIPACGNEPPPEPVEEVEKVEEVEETVAAVPCTGVAATFPHDGTTLYVQYGSPNSTDPDRIFNWLFENVEEATVDDDGDGEPDRGLGHCVVASGRHAGEPLFAEGCLTLKDGRQRADDACPAARECQHAADADSCLEPVIAAAPGEAAANEPSLGAVMRTVTATAEDVRSVNRRLETLEVKVEEAHPTPPPTSSGSDS